jgi:hypothetical protein
MMTKEELKKLGPLSHLVGNWEGNKGDDKAPDSDRTKVENNKYRERMRFEPTGQVDNHDQTLFGLRYSTTAWRLGADDPFHEELGYWMWDAKAEVVIRCFMIPRGVTILAGGSVKADAKTFVLEAKLGSPTFGICSNPYLDKEFKTESYWLKVSINSDGSITYEEDTRLSIPGQDKIFHHTDSNTLSITKRPSQFFVNLVCLNRWVLAPDSIQP